MSQLVDKNGRPIHSSMFKKAKEKPKNPLIGELANAWSGVDHPKALFSEQNMIQADTSLLTLQNYREMADHYQVNSSITVLSFMLHQMDWKITCDNLKIAKHCEDNLRRIWTRLVRALSQAFIFGFSPNGLKWENDMGNGRLVVDKILDYRPEDCRVNWKSVTGVARDNKHGQRQSRKVKVFDGIDHFGQPTIPKENSLWYPLMMQNGDYYGKKLLNAAFQPWFFSNMLHLYANRYYERFGEPIIIARAPFDEEKTINGQVYTGNVLMNGLVNLVRNGSSITLPNDRAQNGIDGVSNFDYTMEFLESQMRGADFERHLTRYDQEISLALFTPLLMMNTADGGSFNLGVVHTQMYQAMLRAIADDWKEYIDRYLLRPMAIYNFGANADLPQIEFQKIGKVDAETGRALLNQLLTVGNDGRMVNVDLEEAGAAIGLTLEQGDILAKPVEQNPVGEEENPTPGGKPDTRVRPDKNKKAPKGTEKSGVSVANGIADRVAAQFAKAYRENTPASEFHPSLGYTSQVSQIAGDKTSEFYEKAESWISAYYGIFLDSDVPSESGMRTVISNGIVSQLSELTDA